MSYGINKRFAVLPTFIHATGEWTWFKSFYEVEDFGWYHADIMYRSFSEADAKAYVTRLETPISTKKKTTKKKAKPAKKARKGRKSTKGRSSTRNRSSYDRGYSSRSSSNNDNSLLETAVAVGVVASLLDDSPSHDSSNDSSYDSSSDSYDSGYDSGSDYGGGGDFGGGGSSSDF